jgi:hypothetical protein
MTRIPQLPVFSRARRLAQQACALFIVGVLTFVVSIVDRNEAANAGVVAPREQYEAMRIEAIQVQNKPHEIQTHGRFESGGTSVSKCQLSRSPAFILSPSEKKYLVVH